MFECNIMSTVDEYEDLIAEVALINNFGFVLDQDLGYDNLRILIFNEGIETQSILLETFIAAIEHAKKRLWKLRKDEWKDVPLEDYK